MACDRGLYRGTQLHTHNFAFASPLSGKEERKWVPVDDLTSLTSATARKTETKSSQAVKKGKTSAVKKCHIAMR